MLINNYALVGFYKKWWYKCVVRNKTKPFNLLRLSPWWYYEKVRLLIMQFFITHILQRTVTSCINTLLCPWWQSNPYGTMKDKLLQLNYVFNERHNALDRCRSSHEKSSRCITISPVFNLKEYCTDQAHWQTNQTYYSVHFQQSSQ
jgi:hypothetical protein